MTKRVLIVCLSASLLLSLFFFVKTLFSSSVINAVAVQSTKSGNWSDFVFSGSFVLAQEHQATFSLSPSTGSYNTNEEFTLQLQINTQDAITAAKAYLSFDPALLQVVKIEPNEQTFPFWWEKEEGQGILRLVASAPGPGVSGNLTLATMRLKVLKAGTAAISYDSTSLVLTPSDENVLNISSSSGATFTLKGAEGQSSSEARSGALPYILGGIGVLGVLAGVWLLWKKSKT